MALDYKKIIETNQKAMKEYEKVDANRRALRIILSRLSEIEFVQVQKEITPAVEPKIENKRVVKQGIPAKYEIVHELPNDRSLGQTIKVERQQAIYDDCIAQLKKIGIEI